MTVMKEIIRYLYICIIIFFFSATVWLTIVQLIRFWKAIKENYIDWILVHWSLCSAVACILMCIFFTFSWLPYEYPDGVITMLSFLHSVMFWLFFQVWSLTTLYPWLLRKYITQLTLLQDGHQFSEVKKSINRYELILIAIVCTGTLTYFTYFAIIDLLVYSKNCAGEAYIGGLSKGFNGHCATINWFNYSEDCIDLVIASILFVFQLVMYRRLNNVMKTRLNYFYPGCKKEIKSLYTWSCIYFIVRMLYIGFYVFTKIDRLDAYTNKSTLSIEMDIIRKCLNMMTKVTLFFYMYSTTKNIHFVSYVWVWMKGNGVEHKFKGMSYLITISCFYEEKDSSISSETDYEKTSLYESHTRLIDRQSTWDSINGINS